jgi:hypothetical protein
VRPEGLVEPEIHAGWTLAMKTISLPWIMTFLFSLFTMAMIAAANTL